MDRYQGIWFLHLKKVFHVTYVTVQPGFGIDYLLGSYALENIKDAERKQAKGALSESLYR